MALGDRVTVLIDVGVAKPREEVVEATGAGGSVAVLWHENLLTVTELTRGNRPKRRVSANVGKVVAVIEEPRR